MKKFPELPENSKNFRGFPTPLSALFLLCLMLLSSPAFAEVPISLTQQGRLLTADGKPMKGSKTLLFEIYNQATEGAVLWSDELEVELNDAGFYTAILGSDDNPIDHIVLQGGQAFMQLVIDDQPLLPRLELTSVPYAQIARVAQQAQSATHAETATSSTTADHANTSGHADTAQSATTATTASTADSVAPGSIHTSSIANQAVTAEKILSIPWSKITDPPTIPTYTGADFVTSGQSCSTAGQMVTGISASGTLICATPTDNDTTYTAAPDQGLLLSGTQFAVAPQGILTGHLASGAITGDKIADGAITIDKIAATVPLYQVTATSCAVPHGGVSMNSTCAPIQPSTACALCPPPTIGGPQRHPYLNCQGACVCLLTAPVCMNQKIGAILFDPEP